MKTLEQWNDDGVDVTVGYGRDVLSLLRQLAAGKPIRIYCGGEAYTDREGEHWASDCFFRGGEFFRGEASEADDAPLYKTERRFSIDAPTVVYRLPVPPGLYRVTVYVPPMNRTVFDMGIEEEPAFEVSREEQEVGHAGLATAKKFFRETKVDDGFLNVEFIPEWLVHDTSDRCWAS